MKLPTKIKIDLWKIFEKQGNKDVLWDTISDYLTETYGYCLNGYGLQEKINIEITDIDWDTSEN